MRRMVLASLLLVLALTGCGLWKTNLPLEGAQGPGDLGSAPTGALRPGDAGLHERRQISAELTEEVSQLSPTLEVSPPPPQPVIVIDPGHAAKAYTGTEPLGPGASEQKQKSTGGTSGAASGLMEHELNLTIALQLRDELTARGYAVVLTRETADVQISNAERAQIANDYDADVYLRIHANGAENSAVNGAMTICTTSKNPFVPQMYAENYRLSECVLNAYCEVTGTKKERIWETDSMSGNNWSNVPTTMIEMGYMTNREEDLRMADPDHQRLMVQGIADGIDAYLSVSGGRGQ